VTRALLLHCLALSLSAADLKPLFAGRSGAALVYDLRENRMEGAWNEARANGTAVRPGSVLKPFTLAAFLEAGLYKPEMNAPEALARSNNEYFERLAARMDPADLERGYARFGLNYRAPTVTLAQLLAAGRRLVARHREVRMRPVFEGMEQAVQYGTARLAGVPATTVAGKTGTTVGSAMFLGYAPALEPRYLVLIHLDAGSGGGDAAPYAAKIFSGLFAKKPAAFDPSTVSLRLFWQNPPSKLNLKPGEYPAGTLIDTGLTRMLAPGKLNVTLKDGKFLVTAQVPLEDYVAAVLHGEAGGFQHRASREAMAIAARTYAARFRGRHSEEGFDFCDTTHCQDARFTASERSELREVVEATASELLWFQGKPAAAYYHADSGGWLEGAGDGPYLKQRRDPWWKESKESEWSWSTSIPKLAADLNLTVIRPVFRVTEREASGRARTLDVFGHPAEAAAFRMLVGRTLGWEKMPSRMFESKVEGKQLRVTGKGRGHGIGLAQSSAERMAAAGKSTEEILATYYPGTSIGVAAGGVRWKTLRSERVTLLTTNVARDRGLLALAVKELAALEALTGWKAEPVIRVYPSREAFRDMTGIVAKVHGATRGRNVKLPPGVELATLRHELLHAVLESNAAPGHPEWLREGLVQALLKEQSAAAGRVRELIAKQGLADVLKTLRRQPVTN
jgi:stage II sporulation protein D